MKTIVPPIKSQGIKTKLVPWIKALTPDVDGRWIEPFLGTGVVGFNSGFSKAIFSDSNPHIINFYRDIQSGKINAAIIQEYLEREGQALSQAGKDGYDHFNRVKDRFNANQDSLDFLFLSRAGFNGMMRFNKKGEWNIPFCKKPHRFRTAYITKIVNQVKNVFFLMQNDWLFLRDTFENVVPLADVDDIIYCDPPYLGRYADYYNGWTEADECLLYELLSYTKAKFILSTWHHNDYRENQMVSKYWNSFNIITRDHFYHSGAKIDNRKSIVEALVFNFNASMIEHNHGMKKRPIQLPLEIEFETAP